MKAVAAIMTSRILIAVSHVGKAVQLTIQGNGNTVDVRNGKGDLVQSVVEEGTVFQKRIFNCKANSQLAMQNPRNKAILAAGVSAEKSGAPVMFDLDGKGAKSYSAHDLFNAYLNNVQFSFNVPLPSSIVDDLGNGVDFSAKIQRIDTEKGSLLTADPKTIRVLQPEIAGATTFSFDDETEVDAEDAFGTEDAYASMDRKALTAAVKAAGIKGLTNKSTDDEIRTALRAHQAEEELA